MDECFICGDRNSTVLQNHHLIPRRYGGSDDDENVVTLCASCHAAIEQLYDRRFFRRLKYHFRQRSGEELEIARIIKEERTGLYPCPVCGRRENRRGVPFDDPQQTKQHIWGSHDDAHTNVEVDVDEAE